MKTNNVEVSNIAPVEPNNEVVSTSPSIEPNNEVVSTSPSIELTLEQEIELKLKVEREKFELKLQASREKYMSTIKQEVETRKLRQLELESKAEELKVQAQAKHAQMLVELKNKADRWLIDETNRIEGMVQNGGQIKTTTGKGLRVEPTEAHVEWADSLAGKIVSFEKNGYPLTGLVKTKLIDYRVGITMIKILGEDGNFYHKAFSSKDKIVVLD